MKNVKRKIVGMVILFAVLCLFVWLKPMDSYSVTERRKLAVFPTVSMKNILNGKFMEDFEEYALDQFPLRDTFRSIKAVTSLKSDNNNLYVAEGHINFMEYPLNEESLSHASKVFQNICGKHLKENAGQIYLSVIPDKNYFFAEENGYLELDYRELVSTLQEQNPNMEYIDIFPLLSGDDYYRTDIHWRQERLEPVAEKLLLAMNTEIDGQSAGGTGRVTEKKDEQIDFYGVYYGQAALPLKPDKISYLTNAVIEDFSVYDYQNGKEIPVYDLEKTKGNDPYEMFLGGSISLLTIVNENAPSNKSLVIFRDSFGSSIGPLLAQGYAKTTLIDVRYIQSAVLDQYVDFENADILFLYSVPVLNNSETLK